MIDYNKLVLDFALSCIKPINFIFLTTWFSPRDLYRKLCQTRWGYTHECLFCIVSTVLDISLSLYKVWNWKEFKCKLKMNLKILNNCYGALLCQKRNYFLFNTTKHKLLLKIDTTKIQDGFVWILEYDFERPRLMTKLMTRRKCRNILRFFSLVSRQWKMNVFIGEIRVIVSRYSKHVIARVFWT